MRRLWAKLISRSLTVKLTLAFLVVSLIGVALVAALVWGITAIEFNRFLTDRGLSTYETAVTDYYQAHSSWTGIAESMRQLGLSQPQDRPNFDQGQNPDQNRNNPPLPFVLVDTSGKVLTQSGPFHEGDSISLDQFRQNVPVKVKNQVVGYVLVTGRIPSASPLEQRFMARTNQALIFATISAVVIALLLGLFLARSITRPVRDLTLASREVARGKLGQQVPVRSQDELGELTITFNQMSADLERSNQARRQMTADIAHDLRTPLSVITGYLEGLKDGVLKPTPARFAAMHDEAIFLQRLIEDLRTLSLADAGELSMNRQLVQPGEVIQRLAGNFQNHADQKQVQLVTTVDNDLPPVRIDTERMLQAMGNLVSNALRYTPRQGQIELSARQVEGHVRLEVRDTGEGISAEALPYVFDRFYRGDDSRQEGGSGLGLAIARSIVELQGGSISASSAGQGQGSRFTILLPCI